MEHAFLVAGFWLVMALVAAIVAYHVRMPLALVEICVGVTAGAVAARYGGSSALGADLEWLRFLASTGALLLTFLAGAELDPTVMRTKVGEVSVVGLIGFFAPFLGCAALAYWGLGWDRRASLLCGIALSTTSMAVVYAVMLETGLNRTEFGKGILGACFVNDLGTVIALGLIFAPFTWRTLVFVGGCVVVLFCLPRLTRQITRSYGFRTAAIRTKWVLLILFGLGALALWSGSEAVLPAYLVGMVLARTMGSDEQWLKRIRTLTVGFLTPFYFLRAGTLVSVPALLATPFVLLALFGGKVVSKIFGLLPVIGLFRQHRREKWYYTLMMSTGLTFGTISALYGYSHGIVDKAQYSCLVAAVIASAVIPTLFAGAFFVPRHLLPDRDAALGSADVPKE